MLSATTRSRSALAHDRLDAHFFTAPGVAATERLAVLEAAGAEVVALRDLASVSDPPRFARAYAAAAEDGIPYLRPYDVFDYLPDSSDRLATHRNRDIERLIVKPGDILQTCSGRNLGPVTIADSSLEGLALSHDMIRISAQNEKMRSYLLAYLKSGVGQALLRRGRSGSVIDHITVADVESLPVVMPPQALLEKVHAHTITSIESAAEARRDLRDLVGKYKVEEPDSPSVRGLGNRWSMRSTGMPDRMDAGYYAPRVIAARERTMSSGDRLGDLARAHLPLRYKRYYVPAEHGRPILSGRQLLQYEPVNLRYVSDRSFRDPSAYELAEGMTVFGAVGRAEGKQGAPSLITAERSSWLASNDVMRLTPRMGVDPARLWLAVASSDARIQINALSFGSVVDHMNPGDVEDIWVPQVDLTDADAAARAWNHFGRAAVEMNNAVRLVEEFLAGAG